MIHHLNGKLIEKNPTHVIIECAGVGYFVNISLNTFSNIKDQENISLFTHLQVTGRFTYTFWFCREIGKGNLQVVVVRFWNRGEYG